MANTSLSLGEHWEIFIKNEVASGRYGSASEVVRAALDQVLDQWHPSVGRSIVEAWGFPDEIVASVDLDESPAGADGSATDQAALAGRQPGQPFRTGPTTSIGWGRFQTIKVVPPLRSGLHLDSLPAPIA